MSDDVAATVIRLTAAVKQNPIASALTCETELDVAFRSLRATLQATRTSRANLARLHDVVWALRQQVAFVLDLNGALLARHNCRINGYDRAGRPAGAGLP